MTRSSSVAAGAEGAEVVAAEEDGVAAEVVASEVVAEAVASEAESLAVAAEAAEAVAVSEVASEAEIVRLHCPREEGTSAATDPADQEALEIGQAASADPVGPEALADPEVSELDQVAPVASADPDAPVASVGLAASEIDRGSAIALESVIGFRTPATDTIFGKTRITTGITATGTAIGVLGASAP
jgi:hypothetical protein